MYETSDFFYSVITFSYTKCFVHLYTVDVVFTLSYVLIESEGMIENIYIYIVNKSERKGLKLEMLLHHSPQPTICYLL